VTAVFVGEQLVQHCAQVERADGGPRELVLLLGRAGEIL